MNPVPDPSSSAASPDFSKVGFGAMGNVEVRHDASQHTTHHVTHDSSTISHTHHDDKSQHIDQSVNQQTTIHHAGLSPMVLFAITCVIIAGFLLTILALRSAPAGAGGGQPQSVPAIVIENKPVVQVDSAMVPQAPRTGEVTQVPGPATVSLPEIVLAEVGVVADGRFTPRTSFKSGELLTLRLKVSRACHVRVLYQPAQGDPVWMYPESSTGSDAVSGGREVLIPDPEKLRAKAPDATAFQLYHDTGRGPPIQEQILIQTADEAFTGEGATRTADSPYRTYQGLTLAEARMRGMVRLQGHSASAAQAQMEAMHAERTLSFAISP
ncbi:DUF4384 domain-containing protein [Prosthecobacter sp.]|uniref:DUF4384 domain-containing protein n=1 Tax=Prosthecobacter sp. TaxID=1965333 RepID=UPI003783A8CE